MFLAPKVALLSRSNFGSGSSASGAKMRRALELVRAAEPELEIDGVSGQTVPSTVERISPVAEDGTRFVAVYLRLVNHDGRLWGGMFASGSILVREKNDALVVPAIALRKDETGYHVLKVLDGHLRRQTVALGSRWNDGSLIEVAAGLKDGETILTAPLPELQPDMAVTIDRAG